MKFKLRLAIFSKISPVAFLALLSVSESQKAIKYTQLSTGTEVSIGCEGFTRNAIVRSILNKGTSEGRIHEDLKPHLTEHPLVLWAREPDIRADGTPPKTPPVTLKEYQKAVTARFEAGAILP